MLALAMVIFFLAASIHVEMLGSGYRDQSAAVAESVIGVVLLVGLLSTLAWPRRTRSVALAVLTFGLLGTFVGLTLLLTVGPMTALDLWIHLTMVGVLVIGLVTTLRAPHPTFAGGTDRSLGANN